MADSDLLWADACTISTHLWGVPVSAASNKNPIPARSAAIRAGFFYFLNFLNESKWERFVFCADVARKGAFPDVRAPVNANPNA